MIKKFLRTFDWGAPVLWLIILLILAVWCFMVYKVAQLFKYIHSVGAF